MTLKRSSPEPIAGRRHQPPASRLHPVIERISALNHSSEKMFIKLGDQLQQFHHQSSALARESADIAGQLAGAEIRQQSEALESVLMRTGTYLASAGAGTQQSIRTLQQFEDQLSAVQQTLRGFHKMVQRLGMLGVSVRIENARLNRDDTGFGTLSEAVKTLAVDIEAKNQQILELAASLQKLIGENLKRAKTLDENRNTDARRLLEEIKQSLAALEERRAGSARAVQQVAEKTRHLQSSTGDIVASLQYHDITRQQLEHVQKALEEIPGRLENRRYFLLPAWTKPQRDERWAAGDACSLQKAQIVHARGEIVDAVVKTKESLSRMACLVEDMQEQSAVLFASGPAGEGHFFEQLEARIQLAGQALAGNARLSGELNQSMEAVARSMEQISGYVREIDHIGMEIRFIALNALIKAVHIGEQGLALGVLAESISHLSNDALAQTSRITANLRSIQELAGSLRQSARQQTSQNQEQAKELESELSAIVGRMRMMDGEICRRMDQVQAGTRELATEITATREKIHIDQVFSATLDDIARELETATRIFNRRRPASADTSKHTIFKELGSRYTMQKERILHERHLAGRAESPFPAIPEKARETSPPVPALPDGSAGAGDPAGELGDNVELF